MPHSRSRVRKRWGVIVALLLIGLVLVPLSADEPLGVIAAPFAEAVRVPLTIVSLVERKLDAMGATVQWLMELHDRNQLLADELTRMKIEHNRLKEVEAAAERYRVLLDFREQCPYPTIVAQVVGRHPTNWYRSLLIAKGKRDGIVSGMGVITPLGAIGRVFKVNRAFSVVRLITDRDSAITAVVQRTRDEGIVQGVENGQAVMKYLPPLSSVKTGDIVVTSGLDGRFPKGMVIGIIKRVEKRVATPFRSATLTLHADFSRLEEVVVLLATLPLDERDGGCFRQHSNSPEVEHQGMDRQRA